VRGIGEQGQAVEPDAGQHLGDEEAAGEGQRAEQRALVARRGGPVVMTRAHS
jgi:hypothetical protein